MKKDAWYAWGVLCSIFLLGGAMIDFTRARGQYMYCNEMYTPGCVDISCYAASGNCPNSTPFDHVSRSGFATLDCGPTPGVICRHAQWTYCIDEYFQKNANGDCGNLVCGVAYTRDGC